MLRFMLLLFLSGMLVLSCSSGGGTTDAAEDGIVDDDGTAGNDETGGGDDDVIECEAGVTKCPQDKDCRCCGSIGPQEICLCTIQCYSDENCQGTGFSLCNMAEGAKSGICTPFDFNCCWNCN